MDVNGQNGKPVLNGASNGAVHHITDHYHEKNGFPTNMQTNLGHIHGKEELINNFQMKIGQDMDLGMKSAAKLAFSSSNSSTNSKFYLNNFLPPQNGSCLFFIVFYHKDY